VQFQLLDVYRGTQLAGQRFDGGSDALRGIAHRISDLLYETLTGERGAFFSPIAYVLESPTAKEDQRYRLQVADSDGANPRTILESRQPILSPAWSPDGKKLAYAAFESGHLRVYRQEIASGIRHEVAGFPGINSAPAWSPDGSRLALTLSRDGNPEIYLVDLRSGQLQRLTENSAIDTEPAFAPDGQSLVFTSDRGGRPQIYQMPAGGGSSTRLTFTGDYNAHPRFAPDGRKLVLVHGEEGRHRIALFDLASRTLQVLTDPGLHESPSFAPNGGLIVYATTDSEGATLAVVSSDGRVRQRLAVPGGKAREPAWAPFQTPP
jgi:TolB protein